MDVCIEVPIAPWGKQRPRACVRWQRGARFERKPFEGASPKAHVYNPIENEQWEKKFRGYLADYFPKNPRFQPVRVDILAVFPRPSGEPALGSSGLVYLDGFEVSKRMARVRKGESLEFDRDNVDKAVLDALSAQKGQRPGFYWDDCCVVAGSIVLAYAEIIGHPLGHPRVAFRVRTLEGEGDRCDKEVASLGLDRPHFRIMPLLNQDTIEAPTLPFFDPEDHQ